jgi:hypothetical protein
MQCFYSTPVFFIRGRPFYSSTFFIGGQLFYLKAVLFQSEASFFYLSEASLFNSRSVSPSKNTATVSIEPDPLFAAAARVTRLGEF